MPRTNSWLCIYAIAQLGKPYKMGTYGAFETSTQTTLCQKNFTSTYDAYTNPNYNKSVKTHDCSGLPLGALMCDSVDGTPTGREPIVHGSTSQYNSDCSTKSNSMKNFPYTPGTLVFVHGDGGIKSHVGIYVGTFTDLNGDVHENAVVEAKGRNWGVVYSSVNNSKWGAWGQLKVCEIDTTQDTTFDARTLTAGNAVGSINIETQNMKPFVAVIPAGKNPKLDYGKIIDARISAMMFFGGEYFDSIHTRRKTYMNSHLAEQVKHCDNAGLPYALYVNVRAKNEIEADAECKPLYYVISRYPPKLGLWLSLQTNNSVAVNNKIVEVYYRYITEWGLADRCGFYVDEKQLSSITWSTFQDRFYLWLKSPMEVDTIDDELLKPEMFEVPD